MMGETLTEKLTKTPEGMRLYQQERAIQELTDLICEEMNEQDVGRHELAKRLGWTARYFAQMLDGEVDMTVRQVSDVFTALDRAIHFQAFGMMAEPLQPFRPVSPGEILKEELEAVGWTPVELAVLLGLPVQVINEIISGEKVIDAAIAGKLSRAFGNSSQFWLNLESSYRRDLAAQGKACV